MKFGVGPAMTAVAEADIGLIKEALVVKDLSSNLLSLAKVDESGCTIVIARQDVHFPSGY